MKINFKSFWDDDLEKQLLKQQLLFFKKSIQEKDDEIFKSKWRKNKGYIPHGILPRTIITKYGRVRYYRRLYKYWDNEIRKWKYVFLVDHEFDVSKYQRIHESLKFEILQKAANGLNHKNINDYFSFSAISNKSISNIINSYSLNLWSSPSLYDIKKVILDKYLYINVDETFCSLRINKTVKKCRIRIVIFHTGLSKVKNRNVLLNKKIYFILVFEKQQINTINFVNDMINFAKNFYTNVDDVTKIISGDSAGWIKSLTEYVPNSCYIADKFHLIRDLKILKSNNKEVVNFLEQGDYQNFINKIKYNYQSLDQPSYLQRLSFSTLKNNKLGIINQSHIANVGTFAESNCSIVKSLFGFNNKSLGFNTFKNMLSLRLAQINGLNIIDLIKQEVIQENLQTQQFYKKSYWKFNNHSEDQDYFYDVDFPLINSNKGKWIGHVLNFDDEE